MTGPVPNLSPSPGRVGRVCVCVWHEERVLLVEHEGLFTFPGGGVDPGEGFEQAAVREAWEEAGARVRLKGLLWENAGREGPERCYLAELEALEPSPEGRAAVWVNPHALPWSEDRQIGPVLRALGLHRERLSLAVPERVRQALELARQHGFDRSCSLEVGRLLRQLAARPELRIAELGTGVGVGAAWMASGMG
ncbi:NUDIX domain-containing protein, partial [Calidithermus terrae]|uniref:NUDIX domain-containing protein n=1 Tax=Calidithermus terrae TaxID=1408545 RepID=UPI000E64C940